MKKLTSLALVFMLCALSAVSASALEYGFEGAEDYNFARPTSDSTIYESANSNTDRSKNMALVPPSFGSPTSYLPGSGEYLTPNLVPGALDGGYVNATVVDAGTISYPTVDAPAGIAVTYRPVQTRTVGYTEVTSDLYYAGGSLGTVEIPSLGVSVKIVQGTDSAQLAKGAGHFEGTSIWNGNVCIASHNRGVSAYFGKIHTLSPGDTIVLTTKLGTRTYAVSSVEKVSEMDGTMLASTSENCITLFTCVMNERPYRWCVRGYEI